MSAERFYVDPGQFQPVGGAATAAALFHEPGTRVRIAGSDARHVRDVLHLSAGDCVVVFDGRGCDYRVVLDRVDRDGVEGKVAEMRRRDAEPLFDLTLIQGIPKGQEMDYIIEKCTELGIACFLPVECERSHLHDLGGQRVARWQRVARAAAQQSGRSRVPEVRPPCRLVDALRAFRAEHPHAPIVVPWEAEEHTPLRRALSAPAAGEEGGGRGGGDGEAPVREGFRGERGWACLVIGPEGGLARSEVEAAQALGAVTVNLGPRILRSDTAAVVASSLVLYEMGELGPRAPAYGGVGR